MICLIVTCHLRLNGALLETILKRDRRIHIVWLHMTIGTTSTELLLSIFRLRLIWALSASAYTSHHLLTLQRWVHLLLLIMSCELFASDNLSKIWIVLFLKEKLRLGPANYNLSNH